MFTASNKIIELDDKTKDELIILHKTMWGAQMGIDATCKKFLVDKGEKRGNFKISEDISYLMLYEGEDRKYVVH